MPSLPSELSTALFETTVCIMLNQIARLARVVSVLVPLAVVA
jgi:hypothetical protein